jgi:alpha-N-acetylglucosaminidase
LIKRKIGKIMLGILKDMDELLASDRHFLLSNWLETAKTKAQTLEEREIYEWDARCQITLWSYSFNSFVIQ